MNECRMIPECRPAIRTFSGQELLDTFDTIKTRYSC